MCSARRHLQEDVIGEVEPVRDDGLHERKEADHARRQPLLALAPVARLHEHLFSVVVVVVVVVVVRVESYMRSHEVTRDHTRSHAAT